MDFSKPASHDEDDIWNANTTVATSSDSFSGNVTFKLTDLPDKCLINIFKWIPFSDLDNIIEFSPRWDRLVQEHIPVETYITDIGFRIALHYFVGYTDLPKYRVQVIHSRVLDEPLPDLKTPEDLQILNFATHTELSTYKHLIGKAKNLEELYFGYSSLSGQLLCEVDVILPKLTLLYMADRIVESKKLGPEQQTILPRNITGFLGKTFPSIQKIVVCTVATRHQTAEYVKELFKFIQRHSNTLKIIKCIISTSMQSRDPNDPVNDLVEFSSTEENFNMELLANVKLTEIDVKLGKGFFCGIEQWRWILQHQKELSHLTIGIERPISPQIFEAPMNLSASNLVSVQIGVQVYDSSISAVEERRSLLDCSIFANCVNLKMLVLNGPPISTTVDEGRSAGKELINLNKLPEGLYGLAVENIYLETKQTSEFTRGVMQKERTLERLSLQYIGTSAGFGVTLAMLDCWLTSKAFEEIIVRGGMNSDESRLPEYAHLAKFGVVSPVAKSSVHAFFYPNFMEYKRPAEFCQEVQPSNLPFM